jgi:hypothetical protein
MIIANSEIKYIYGRTTKPNQVEGPSAQQCSLSAGMPQKWQIIFSILVQKMAAQKPHK